MGRPGRRWPAPAGELTMAASNPGHCNICEESTTFVEEDAWLRDHYRCIRCRSIPRNRALVNGLELFSPDWRSAAVHESSPAGPLSAFLKRSCRAYSSSYLFDDVPRGTYRGDHRSEDLSSMTFADASFDVVCTSDVFEHVLEPEKALAEIGRVMKAGGAHVFTMPWYPALPTSVVRAQLAPDGRVTHLLEPVYHGNPLSDHGALVTRDWGLDVADVIYGSSGLHTVVYLERDRAKGLDGEFLEVFVSRKR